MVGCLLSLWNSFTDRRRKKDELKSTILDILTISNSKDDECKMLALSLALETLPEEILNYAVPINDYGWPYDSFGTDIYERTHSLKELIELGLKHKEIEPVRKHTYNFLTGCIYTLRSVLGHIAYTNKYYSYN